MTTPWRPADITDEIRGECTDTTFPNRRMALLDQGELDAARQFYTVPDEHVHVIWQKNVVDGHQFILWPMRLNTGAPH